MLIDLATEGNVVDKSGAWLSYKGDRIGQGRENAKQFLQDHPEIALSIEREVLAQHGLTRGPVTVVEGGKPTGVPVADGDPKTVDAARAKKTAAAKKSSPAPAAE